MSQVLARGWATVDLDRGTAELADLLEPRTAFVDAPRSAILGARSRLGRAGSGTASDAGWIVLLEPDTEGRLAAFLAREGEGWAATWTASGDGEVDCGTPGPLGRERLVAGAAVAGPFRLLLTAATIDR